MKDLMWSLNVHAEKLLKWEVRISNETKRTNKTIRGYAVTLW